MNQQKNNSQWLLIRFFVAPFSFFIFGSLSLSTVVNIFRVHPQLLQITDFSITIYFDMYFYAISRQFVVRAQPKAAASAPKNCCSFDAAPAASFISLHPPLSFSRFLQRGICIINCQQCHKIFSLVSFCFISLPSTSSSLLFFFVFRDSFVLFHFCCVVSSQNIFKIFGRKGAQKETERENS